jgi:1,4-alpha-glucan branching enzyme
MTRFHASILIIVTGLVCGCHRLPAVLHPHEIRFTLIHPDASEVSILTSLNRYAPVSMKQTFSGEWEVYLPDNETFDYFFKVDGIPYTPECRLQQTDDWGGRLCIYSSGIQEP